MQVNFLWLGKVVFIQKNLRLLFCNFLFSCSVCSRKMMQSSLLEILVST